MTKLFPKGFDRQNSIFPHPNGKIRPAPDLHLTALNFEFSRAIFLHFFSRTRLKKFSPRPRGKSVMGKILFEYMIKVAKVLFLKIVC